MFKNFSNSNRNNAFNSFPNLNFQMNNQAYGFSGCTFWLDAAYGLNTQTDGASISSWVDRITGNNFSQSTGANQPTLTASYASFNNLPAVNFTSVGRFLTGSRVVPISNQITIAFVFHTTVQSATRNTLLQLANSSSGVLVVTRTAATNGISANNGNTIVMDSTVIDLNPHVVVITNNEIVVDGVQKVTGSWTPANAIGVIGDSATAFSLRSYVGEILVFNNRLTSSDCVALSDNINSKYAIY